jgi:two-component system NtrC family sensor kinase
MFKKKTNFKNQEKEYSESRENKSFLKRPSISIRTKLVIAFSLIFALSAAITIWSIITIEQIMDKIEFLKTSDNYKSEILEARRFEKNYLLYGTNLNDAQAHAQNAKSILEENPETIIKILGSSDYLKMKSLLSDYQELLEKFGEKLDDSEKTIIEHRLREHGLKMIEAALNFENIERQSVDNMLRLAHRIPFIFLFLLLLSIIFIISFLARQLLGSLARFMKYTERIANGDFSPIPPQRKYQDEFSQLRMAFNHMIKELDHRHKILVESHKLRAVGTLVAGVAHELNNPLNNTMLTAWSLREDFNVLKDEEKVDMINDVIKETERSQKIVCNLLNFARESEVKLIPLNLNEILEDSIHLVANQVKLSKINLIRNFSVNISPIHGDAQMLQQVFVNLILNAIDAIQEKGTITISTFKNKDDKYITAEIKDDGPGIPEHILERIFEPFFTTKSLRKGTGLGLSVSRGILRSIGGYITVESKPNKGAAFKVILPTTNIPSDFNPQHSINSSSGYNFD